MRTRSASVSVGLSPGRAARHEEVNAGVDLTAAKSPDRRLVELAGLGERGDERRADAGPSWFAYATSLQALGFGL